MLIDCDKTPFSESSALCSEPIRYVMLPVAALALSLLDHFSRMLYFGSALYFHNRMAFQES